MDQIQYETLTYLLRKAGFPEWVTPNSLPQLKGKSFEYKLIRRPVGDRPSLVESIRMGRIEAVELDWDALRSIWTLSLKVNCTLPGVDAPDGYISFAGDGSVRRSSHVLHAELTFELRPD